MFKWKWKKSIGRRNVLFARLKFAEWRSAFTCYSCSYYSFMLKSKRNFSEVSHTIYNCTLGLYRSIHGNQNIVVIENHSNIYLHLSWWPKQDQHVQVTLIRPPDWALVCTIVHNPYLPKLIKKWKIFQKLVKRVYNWRDITCILSFLNYGNHQVVERDNIL